VVLLIEDEPAIRTFIRVVLRAEGYQIVETESARHARSQAGSCQPDAILLDLGLPDGDGVALTPLLRSVTRAPIIVISARHGERDKVAALDAGADDYLTKPFGVDELLARLRAALRRARAGRGPDPEILECGPVRMDARARRVTVRGREVHLTPNEYRMLAVLLRNADGVVTHAHLLREVWGPGATGEAHYLRVYASQLRQKIEEDPANPRLLVTETGIGYRLRADGSDATPGSPPRSDP
jgi:two-component system KDP operon response regulator KdpE